MTLIVKARSLREGDTEVLKNICAELSPKFRGGCREKIFKNTNFPTDEETERVTTLILQKIWEGNHLLEYYKKAIEKITLVNLDEALKQYEFPRYHFFRNQFASGFGKEKTKKLFFVLATAQKISVLYCLKQFLEFCLNAQRPLRYFYADKDKSLLHYVEVLNKSIKAHKNKKDKLELKLTLLEEEQLKLKTYIDNINQYLKNNPEKSDLKADIDSNPNIIGPINSLAEKTSESDSSVSPQPTLTIPDPEEGNINYYANIAHPLIGRGIQKIRLKKFLKCDLEKSQVVWFQLAGVAGQGKSRLAFELMHYALKKLKWRAGFLTENDINSFGDCWNEWEPNTHHLLIIDDIIGREKKIKSIIQTLIHRKRFQHKIRILLLEQQRWDQGIILNTTQDNNDVTSQSTYISDKAQWFLNLGKDDNPSASRLVEYRFDNGVEELIELDEENLIRIIRQLISNFPGKEISLNDSELKETLKRIDDSGRPLYAYLLAQQLNVSEEGFKSWKKIGLLIDQLIRNRNRWEKTFKEDEAPAFGDNHPAMKLAILATIVRTIKFDAPQIKQHFGIIDSPLGKESASIATGFIPQKSKRPHEITALKPDLLGEWFVLYCIHQGLEFEELMNLAWEYWPNETALFLQRITHNFIGVADKKYNIKEIIQKLLAYKPFAEAHCAALAKVAINIAQDLQEKNIILPQTIISALVYAANLSDTVAMNLLGILYSEGKVVEKNLKESAKWFNQGVKKGDVTAIHNLGFCYKHGLGVKKNLNQAINLYKEAVKLGSSRSMVNLGLCYEQGKGVVQSWKIAIELYERAIKLKNSTAMLNLGACYEHGEGVEKNVDMAFSLYSQAFVLGNNKATFKLGSCYYQGEGVEKNFDKAVDLYNQAIELGDTRGLNNLGVCYEKGHGVEQDWEKAAVLYQLAVDQGYITAMVNLGFCYQEGEGVEQNPKKAFDLFQKAAKKGNSLAMANLGICYLEGIAVSQDLNKALNLFRKGIKRGCAEAMYNLGICYRDGIGVKKSWDKAVKLFQRAWEAGDTRAMAQIEYW